MIAETLQACKDVALALGYFLSPLCGVPVDLNLPTFGWRTETLRTLKLALEFALQDWAEWCDPDLFLQPAGAVNERLKIVQLMAGVVPFNDLGLARGLGVAFHRRFVEVSLERPGRERRHSKRSFSSACPPPRESRPIGRRSCDRRKRFASRQRLVVRGVSLSRDEDQSRLERKSLDPIRAGSGHGCFAGRTQG